MNMGAARGLATLILVLLPIGALGKQEQTTKDTPQPAGNVFTLSLRYTM